jgi:L-serine dehydratase
VLAGTLVAVRERLGLTREQQVDYLFTAGAFGLVIANHAGIAGAEGGCQAEVGSASAMAAAALVAAKGGTPDQSAQAVAITIANMLGLICDPVAGLVEIPCIKRNALGASQALVSADMALAGVRSVIPPDEVIDTMGRVGRQLPAMFRETAEGGLAQSPTGRKLMAQVFGEPTE